MKKLVVLLLIAFSLTSKAQTNFYDPSQVREIKLSFYDTNWQFLLDSIFEAGTQERILADITIDGVSYDSVGVRYKGYSSVNPGEIKNPFNIDLDYMRPDQNHLGFIKIKLSNVIHDPSFIREVLSYEIARKYMPASRAGFAMLYANDTLIGLYTNVETVNKDFLESHFGSRNNAFFKGSPETLIYPSGSNANLQYYSDDSTSLYPYYSMESDYGWAQLNDLTNILNNQTDSIENILNTDRAFWMLAFDYALVNLDSYLAYAQNYYVYRDDNLQFNTIPWDMNMSFGSFRFADGGISGLTGGLSVEAVKTVNPLALLSYSVSPRPLIKKLLVETRYKNMYLAHIRTIIEECFVSGEYIERGEELISYIDDYVYADSNKFYQDSDFVDNFYEKVGGSGGMIEYPGIVDLMTARTTFLSGFSWFTDYPVFTDHWTLPENPAPGTEVTFITKLENADSCFLSYRLNDYGKFITVPMYDDGMHNDSAAGDFIFGYSLTVENVCQYYYYSENTTAGMFSPQRAAYEYYVLPIEINLPELVINEFMCINIANAQDEYGQFDDWVEIYNNSDVPVNMAGLFLSDDTLNLKKWAFPDTTINAGGYLVIWADNDIYQPGLHTGFQLASAGESVVLSMEGGYIIDEITFPVQFADITYGRYPNGTGSFQFLPPSIGAENYPSAIEEIDREAIKVYPNPASDFVFVDFMDGDEAREIKIYNMFMQEVYSGQYSESLCRIDISNISAGTYFLKSDGVVVKIVVY
ncbi:MAG: hypothetical protein A2W91_13495 [Bacteroidetes bacterium GWF2_38_335]|nr:MAG: hypothetical protein A2W91_13495 [Bacteroidetes bacterium GWF2_38_335]OFY77266.1 MAG: hypothetical protein A2281_15160 [Bacteroidetes bacterium RIFOXYA12_FULL_38_20]HBS85730.1 hypothetical protein [Bacteroidales bacterium]